MDGTQSQQRAPGAPWDTEPVESAERWWGTEGMARLSQGRDTGRLCCHSA